MQVVIPFKSGLFFGWMTGAAVPSPDIIYVVIPFKSGLFFGF